MNNLPDLETIIGIEVRISEIEDRLEELNPAAMAVGRLPASCNDLADDDSEWDRLVEERQYLVGRQDRLAKLLTGNR